MVWCCIQKMVKIMVKFQFSQMHTHAYRVIIFYSYPIRVKNVFFKRFLYFLTSKNKIFIVL